ncbi:phosphoglucosamine mutase [[Clostridium] methylpentosum DSM 5476]|uniref:Phosphoglucosamine mutase n=1 Tax=[Clostridium] methylpentosum DSM 5476 TaxID=537013 RepID=C0EG89_9FIRM|nr:phosphoglucosamine mutase [[Clostridium] methylpentosum DSM 5476]MEE1492229.1 phosphoglucosamine mutase [Massilioclostridium sp.]
MGRLFGTDGARGVANTELTCELAMQIGRAAATVLTRHTSEKPMLLIGRDTRISSKMLEAALVAGICSVGADVTSIGVIPTPAVAYLVGKYKADAGIMISASHNPVEFNGIKIFNNEGFKLSDEIENEIEELILDHPEQIELKSGIELGRMFSRRSAVNDYVKHIASTIDGDLSGMRVAVDCANGSASTTAELLFKGLGAVPLIIHAEPDGTNINDNCGSTHMDSLIAFMKRHNCQVGVAFDGDADRCLAVDEHGEIVDGDKMIAIFAKDMHDRGVLVNDTAVVTVMTNLGFFHFTKAEGINTVATKVGDRYVLEEMRANGHIIGGEQSGHIIFSQHASTGDGQLSAVKLLHIMKESEQTLSSLSSVMERFPQVLVNVKADSEAKARYAQDQEIAALIEQVGNDLGDNGRILVRPSGTEPIVRVMIEGKNLEEIQQLADSVAKAIEERIH